MGLAISVVYNQTGTSGIEGLQSGAYVFGAGPWDAFNGDLSALTGMSVSLIIFLEGLILVIISTLFAKTKFPWIALATGFLISVFISLTAPVSTVINPTTTLGNFFTFMAYVGLLTLGIAFCVESSVCISPIEKAVTDIYYETGVKERFSYKFFRSAYESLPVWGSLVLIILVAISGITGFTTNLTIFTVLMFIFIGPIIAAQRAWVRKLFFKENKNEI